MSREDTAFELIDDMLSMIELGITIERLGAWQIRAEELRGIREPLSLSPAQIAHEALETMCAHDWNLGVNVKAYEKCGKSSMRTLSD